MHLAGRFGAMVCSHCVQQGWLLQKPKSRALELTPGGARRFREWFGLARWDEVLAG
jgi:hypothetical protein